MDVQYKSLEVSKLFREIMFLMKQNMTKVFEDCGITAPQGMVMGSLSKHGKMKISELSIKLGLSNSTTSGIIDRLEKQKMVERERSEEDKRVVFVKMTPKFEELHKGFHMTMEENISNIMKKGTADEIEDILLGLNILKKLLY